MAKKKGVSVERMEQYEEKATNSLFYALAMMGHLRSGDSNMLTDEGAIYLEEQIEIQKIAMEGKAIFLGHCASEALKDKKGVVRVFTVQAAVRKNSGGSGRIMGLRIRRSQRRRNFMTEKGQIIIVPIRQKTGKIGKITISYWILLFLESTHAYHF